jgi:hypothetical protein
MAEKMKYECHFGGQDFLIRQFISQPCPITKKDCFFEINFVQCLRMQPKDRSSLTHIEGGFSSALSFLGHPTERKEAQM